MKICELHGCKPCADAEALAASRAEVGRLTRILGKLSCVVNITAGKASLVGLPHEQLDAIGHLIDWAEARARRGHKLAAQPAEKPVEPIIKTFWCYACGKEHPVDGPCCISNKPAGGGK